MNAGNQSTGNILLSYESLPRGREEPQGYVKVTVYLNTAEDLSCVGCHGPIEKGMPIVEEVIKDVIPIPTRHLLCFDLWINRLGRAYEANHIGLRDFISKNPDLIVLEKLKGIGP